MSRVNVTNKREAFKQDSRFYVTDVMLFHSCSTVDKGEH